jgi:phosphoglycerate dehydrogenase-like enzyme
VLLVALVPEPTEPEFAEAAYGGMLGEGWEVRAFRTQEEVPNVVAAEAEFVVAATPQTIGAQLLSRMPRVRLVQVPGHGYDHVSLEDAAAVGVPVANVGSSGAEAHTVAEMTILLAGAVSRRLIEGDRRVRAGEWGQVAMLQTGVLELAGKSIGLVGFGRIAREVARRAHAFGMKVLYHDPKQDADAERELGAEFKDLDALLAEADVVTLHLPLTPKTEGIIGAEALGKMKGTAILVNTARGALVDEQALVKALEEGRIRGYGTDVFDPEPPSPDSPILSAPNVVLSPHMAGVTGESLLRILQAAFENCQRVAGGEQPLDLVTE